MVRPPRKRNDVLQSESEKTLSTSLFRTRLQIAVHSLRLAFVAVGAIALADLEGARAAGQVAVAPGVPVLENFK